MVWGYSVEHYARHFCPPEVGRGEGLDGRRGGEEEANMRLEECKGGIETTS